MPRRRRLEQEGPNVRCEEPEPKLVGGRVSLRRLADHQHYPASKETDGRIVLTPALGTGEILDYQDAVRAYIIEGLKHPTSWVRRRGRRMASQRAGGGVENAWRRWKAGRVPGVEETR